MTRVVCSLEHPIIFVFDFDNEDVEIPEYDESKVVSRNENCLSVRAISDVDGDVKIGLNESVPENMDVTMIEVFKGTIATPNRKLSVVNSQNEKLLETDVSTERTGVRVMVDDEKFPERIEVATCGP